MGAHPALEVIAWSGYDTGVMRQMVRAAGILRFVAKQEALTALRAEVEAASSVLVGKGLTDEDLRSAVPRSRRERRRHDAGPLIQWGLASGFKRSAIARVVQVANQTVDHHAKSHRKRAVDDDELQ